MAEQQSKDSIGRVPTGIFDLDELLEGGFPRNDCILVCGTPGTAKTTFALQFIVNGALKYGEKGVFISVEERRDLVINRFARLGWDLEKMESDGLLMLKCPETIAEEGDDPMEDLLDENFLKKVDEFGAKRIAIDSLNMLLAFSETCGGPRRGTEKLAEVFRQRGLTSVMTYERGSNGLDKIDFRVEEFVADGLIYLEHIRRGSLLEKTVSIIKMKGTNHSNRVHPFKIGDGGMKILHTEEVL